MNIYKEIEAMHAEMRSWRQYLHQHPETAFEEFNTSTFISAKLREFGLEVHEGLAITGVVASLSCGNGNKKIALRADMDALFIQEKNELSYKSKNSGKMHACGHDGHSAMLLGAAKYLAEHTGFNGTVYFIFQPAEEGRAGAHLVTALQSVVSRNVNPADPAVLSITQIHGGDTWNALPDSVVLRGTFRCFNQATQQLIENRIRQLVESIAQGFSLESQISINPENAGYPVTCNTDTETAVATEVAQELVGIEQVDLHATPSMGSEDFAFMLQEKPGCYVWLGNGSSDGECLLHNPHYDFNDEILTVGATYWVKLVERILN